MLSMIADEELFPFLMGLQLMRNDLKAMHDGAASLSYNPAAYLVRHQHARDLFLAPTTHPVPLTPHPF